MKRLSIALFTILLFAIACDNIAPSENTEVVQQSLVTEVPENPLATPDSSDINYELIILKGDLPSPRKELRSNIEDTTVKINYGSPSKKGRSIWGGLVPFNKVWRTGANEATRISISKDILVEGQKLAAGVYGLFSLPSTDKMEIIFNKEVDQWGAFEYQEAADVLRVSVNAQATKSSAETMDFSVVNNTLVLRWANRLVPIQLAAAKG